MILKILVFIVAGMVLGGFLGKNILDSISEVEMKKIIFSLVLAGGAALILLIGAIFWTGYRIPCLTALAAGVLCAWMSFRYFITYNTKYGILTAKNENLGQLIPDLVYDENKPENRYDLYLPAEASEDGTYGLAVYIHGGGFSSGSRKDGDGWCRYTTAMGYVSITVDYTLITKESKSSLPLMTQEILKCVAATEEKCAALGYPLTEMALSGGSAGGCLASLYAYGQASQSPIPVKFIFTESAPVYFDPVCWGNMNGPKEQASFVAKMSGEEITENMVIMGEHMPIIDSISPALLVKEGSIPTLCAYGAKDKVVPVQLKNKLFEALERCHVPYAYIEYPRSGHMLYSDPKAQKEFLAKLDEFFDTYFNHKPRKWRA